VLERVSWGRFSEYLLPNREVLLLDYFLCHVSQFGTQLYSERLHNKITLIIDTPIFPSWVFPGTSCPKIMVSLVCLLFLLAVDL